MFYHPNVSKEGEVCKFSRSINLLKITYYQIYLKVVGHLSDEWLKSQCLLLIISGKIPSQPSNHPSHVNRDLVVDA